MKHINPNKFSYKGVESLPKSEDANGIFMDDGSGANLMSNDFLFSNDRHPIFSITGGDKLDQQ
jgi:hypothetical protein